jgi:hypothetical protein
VDGVLSWCSWTPAILAGLIDPPSIPGEEEAGRWGEGWDVTTCGVIANTDRSVTPPELGRGVVADQPCCYSPSPRSAGGGSHGAGGLSGCSPSLQERSFHHKCSVSRWRPQKVDKRMVPNTHMVYL